MLIGGMSEGAASFRICVQLAQGTRRVAVEAFAVEAHARGDHQALHRSLDEGFEQHGRAEVVDPGVVRHLVHALPHADCAGEVVDGIDARERRPNRLRIAHVPDLQLDLR